MRQTLATQTAITQTRQKEDDECEAMRRADKLEQRLDRVRSSLVPMSSAEDAFSLLLRFERTMVSRNIDKFQWVVLVEVVLRGKLLDTYHCCVDSCVGNWELLKAKLLESGGFGTHDCLDMYCPKFRQSGSLEASTWAKITSYRTFVVLKNSGVMSKFSDDDLTLISQTVANGFPNLINLTLDGTVNNVPALLILDTAADVCMCSSNLVSSSNSPVSRRTISGIDNVNHSLPCYLLPLSTHGVQGKCLFASFPKFPSGSVLVGLLTPPWFSPCWS